ncbi:hypothetical protein AB0M39_40085 [Streptomyces sp. NPDC051907]|uniref:hypothetical protein n=1 Tax=Streptomyces sp. NPDC051907 TaxID=3155284 RepID=UPI00344550E6
MNDPSPHGAQSPAPTGPGHVAGAQSGVIGIGLAAVLAIALAQGSWQWFATYIGVTLLAVILAFQHLPAWTPGARSVYARALAAYSLVVGLCVVLALAPMLQRWSWLFPMPATRAECRQLGRYEAIETTAALGSLAGRDSAALARAQEDRSGKAVAECLAAATTLWLPLYGAGAAVLVGAGTWSRDRARARKGLQPRASSSAPADPEA